MPSPEYCRELALDEPLFGSAPEATRWIALEDNGRWGAKVPRESELPESVRAWLAAQERPGTRVVLIRRAVARRGPTRRLIVARTPSEPSERRLVELDVDLDELDQLARLDLDALLDAAPIHAPDQHAPLWLVCTHGARDRCCAKWGMPIVEALVERHGERVWQSSHLGGHRFAPTFVALPHGLMWGRLGVESTLALADALGQGRVAGLAGLRGRSCWPLLAQAAEAMLRQAEPELELDALILAEVVALGDDRHRVEFALRGSEARRSVELARETFAGSPASCGDTPEPRRVLVQLAMT